MKTLLNIVSPRAYSYMLRKYVKEISPTKGILGFAVYIFITSFMKHIQRIQVWRPNKIFDVMSANLMFIKIS